jgi:hypothetical protein
MTDHPRDDDLLRDALRAEAEGVHAEDALLAHIRAAIPHRASRRAQRGRWLVAAALVIVVGIGAAALAHRDNKPARVDAVDDPTARPDPDAGQVPLPTSFPCPPNPGGVHILVYLDPTASEADTASVEARLKSNPDVVDLWYVDQQTTYQELAELFADDPELVRTVTPDILPPSYRLVVRGELPLSAVAEDAAELRSAPGVYEVVVNDCPFGASTTGATAATEGDHPSLVALVRKDGWLVTVDLGTGMQRELHFAGDPNDTSQEGGPYFIDSVDLSPDGQWVYFSTCCEPASGISYRVLATGGEPEEVGFGAYPRVSPDGRFVATADTAYVSVFRTDDLGFQADAVRYEVGCCVGSLTWSPDGSQLAYVIGTGEEGQVPQVELLDFDGTSLTPADTGKSDNPGWFASWTPDGVLVISDGDPVADDLGLSQDTTFRWLLWVDEAGVVLEQAGHEGSARPPIDAPEAIAADW